MAAASREARLTLRLIDAVSGPSRAAAAALRGLNQAVSGLAGATFNAPARAISGMARQFSAASQNAAAMSGVISLGIGAGARELYDLEKQLNVSMASGGLSLEQRNAVLKEAINLNSEYAASSGGIVSGINELLRSGLDYEQTMGSIHGVLDTAQAMDVPISEASAAIVGAMVALRMEMGSTEKAMASSVKMADLYAHALNETAKATLDDFTTSGRYFNPVAASMGMSPEETMAWQISLVKAGIMGSSAGTGLRAAPVRIVAPSKKARGALAGLGIDHHDFLGNRTGEVTGDMLAAVLEASGLNAEGLEAPINALLKDPALVAAPAALANAIMDQFGEQLGIATAEDRAGIADALQRAITTGASEVDMIGFLKAMKAAGAGLGDYAAIFGLNHASKMQAIDPALFDQVYADILANSAGTAERMRKDMMHGIVGDVAEFTAAIGKMFSAIGAAGVLDDAAKAIDAFATSLNSLAETNKALLRFGTYAALAVTAIAPLGLAISGVGAVAALAANPITWLIGGLGTLAALNFRPVSDALGVFAKSAMRAFDPAIVARAKSTVAAVKDFAAGLVFREGDADALGQFARNFGIRFAEGANAAYAALPKLRELAGEGLTKLMAIGEGIAAFARGAWVDLAPRIAEGFNAIKDAVTGFAVDRIHMFSGLADAIVDFAERAAPAVDSSKWGGLQLIADGFNAFAAALGAISRVIGGASDGIVSFSTAFLENLSPGTLKLAGDFINNTLKDLAQNAQELKRAFDMIDIDLTAVMADQGEKTAQDVETFIAAVQRLNAEGGRQLQLLKTDFANLAAAASDAWNAIYAWGGGEGGAFDFTGSNSQITKFVNDMTMLFDGLTAAINRTKAALGNWSGEGGVFDFTGDDGQFAKLKRDMQMLFGGGAVTPTGEAASSGPASAVPAPTADVPVTAPDVGPIKREVEGLSGALGGLGSAAQSGMADVESAVSVKGAAAAAHAATSGQGIKDGLSITARPQIDTSSIDHAIGRAEALKRSLASIPGASVRGATTGITGADLQAMSGPEWADVKPEAIPLAGKRAAGGPMRAGLTYRINEKGVETITPGRNSYVTPAHRAGGGGVTIQNVNLYSNAKDGDGLAADFVSGLDRRLSRSRQISIDGR